MRVDLPSSTDPAVTRRSRPVAMSSEVANALPVLHRRLGDAVVGARLTALGHPRRRDLRHDLLQRRRARDDAAGARHVADGAEAHPLGERLLAVHPFHVLAGGVEHAVAPKDLALVREVDRRQLELLTRDVLPDVELSPVRDGEHADVLAAADARVVEVPELGPLRARIPLAEVVAEAEDAPLGARALL